MHTLCEHILFPCAKPPYCVAVCSVVSCMHILYLSEDWIYRPLFKAVDLSQCTTCMPCQTTLEEWEEGIVSLVLFVMGGGYCKSGPVCNGRRAL